MLLTLTYRGINTQDLGYLLHKNPYRAQQFDLARELFEPLGYEVKTKREILDDKFPEWGSSPYIRLTLHGNVRLSELLNHLYVLIPVFDKQKHYYTDEGEIDKLLSHGEGWLADHPAKEKIAARYLSARRSYARKAIDALLEADADENTEDNEQEETTNEKTSPEARERERKKKSLNTMRMNAVRDTVLATGAESVIDLGCGEGRLTAMLLDEKQIKSVAACDVSVSVLEKAASRLKTDSMPEFRRKKLTLMQASLTYRDKLSPATTAPVWWRSSSTSSQ